MLTATANRTDIQVLRGIAVGLVVAYHAHIPPFAGGYLGVDVFFVISGYLITKLISRDIANGSFSLRQFYVRRAWRLLPAAYVTFALCGMIAPYLLTSVELQDFTKQFIGSIAFIGNVTLWMQSGYFDQHAEVKPLLHVWSLAVEEQFYLVLPALLLLVPQRRWSFAIILATLFSLALCLSFVTTMPEATFYWLPTRAWELGVGGAAALLTANSSPTFRVNGVVSWLCLIVIPVLAARPMSATHPGVDAIVICSATAWLLVAPLQVRYDVVPAQIVARLDDISYSLYLVHWPIFAFINSANMTSPAGPRWPFRLMAVAVAVTLAAALYVGIERRFRINRRDVGSQPSGFWLAAIAASLLLTVISLNQVASTAAGYASRFRLSPGLADDCAQSVEQMWGQECSNSSDPIVAVWGDSHAMQFAGGLASESAAKVIQMARHDCAALLDIAMLEPPKRPRTWADACVRFNNDTLAGLAHNTRVEVVILASRWDQMINRPVTHSGTTTLSSTSTVAARLTATIEALRAIGKRVIVVESPPSIGFDVGRCWLKMKEAKLFFGAPRDCRIPFSEYAAQRANTGVVLAQVQKATNVPVFSYQAILCGAEWCDTSWAGIPLYRDGNHLSVEGAALISQKIAIYSDMLRRAN